MELVILWLALSFLAGYLADRKGRSFVGYCLIAFFLSPLIGLLAAAIATPNQPRLEAAQISAGAMRKCPHCAEPVRAEAKICRYCQHELPPHTSPAEIVHVNPPASPAAPIKTAGTPVLGIVVVLSLIGIAIAAGVAQHRQSSRIARSIDEKASVPISAPAAAPQQKTKVDQAALRKLVMPVEDRLINNGYILKTDIRHRAAGVWVRTVFHITPPQEQQALMRDLWIEKKSYMDVTGGLVLFDEKTGEKIGDYNPLTNTLTFR